MSIKKHFTVVSFCLMVLTQSLFSQIVFQGVITDNGAEYLGSEAEPVVSALVTVTDQADTTRSFSGYTNEQGEYSIVIWATGVGDNNSSNPGRFNLQQNYPNPFNPSTVIGYELSKPSHIRIEIYNALGQKVKTLLDGFESISGHVTWDGTNDIGRGVPAGVYIYSLKAEGKRINRKMLLIDGNQGGMPASAAPSYGTSLLGKTALHNQLSDQYTLTVTGENLASYQQQNLEIIGSMTADVTVTRTVTDIDGNIYITVKIGDKWWMAENLKVTHYRNGDSIPNIISDSEWKDLSTGAYCNYNNDSVNVATYGRLYNWFAVNTGNLCPTGWHVPKDAEWQTLVDFLGGGFSVAGGKMKTTGTIEDGGGLWYSPNTGATNSSGFSALPAGYCGNFGDFTRMGSGTIFWSASASDTYNAWNRGLVFDYSGVYRYTGGSGKNCGMSIRCVRD